MLRLIDKENINVPSQIKCRQARSRLINILTLHFFERLFFVSVGIVIPLKLVSAGIITGPETGLFFFLLFFMYRCTPLLFSFFARYIKRELIFTAGVMVEAAALMLLVYSQDPATVFLLALLAGIGGGASTTMLISLIESADLDAKTLRGKIANHDIFNIHLMLINVCAFIAPLFAFLPAKSYQAIAALEAAILFALVINMFRLGNINRHDRNIRPAAGGGGFDRRFCLIWLATLAVWAAASIVYAILPSLDSVFLGQDGVNLWLSFDALLVVALFFALKFVSRLENNNAGNAACGLTAVLGGLLLIVMGDHGFYSILTALAMMAFGGYIAFGQLYGLAMQTRFPHRKTLYLGLLSFAGALGEGGMQCVFWLTGSVDFSLSVACGLVLIGLTALFGLKNTRSSFLED